MQLDPRALPDIDAVRQRCRALAMLDAILCPEWDYRYYSFNTHWSTGQEMASMRNGQGDEWFILFGDFGAAIKGFDHETEVGASGALVGDIRRDLPAAFESFVDEPAFSMENASFCYWRGRADAQWQKIVSSTAGLANEEDGSVWCLDLLVADALGYQAFAKAYFECDVPLKAIEAVYAQMPLNQDIIKLLNSELDLADLSDDAAEIGYPVA